MQPRGGSAGRDWEKWGSWKLAVLPSLSAPGTMELHGQDSLDKRLDL